MSSSLPPMPAPPSNVFVAWVKRHKVWSAAIGIIALLFLIGLIAPDPQPAGTLSASQLPPSSTPSTTTTPEPSTAPITVKVPPVTGTQLDQALRKLKTVGLHVAGRSKQYSHKAPGTVLKISVREGSKLEKGSTVTLVVAQPFPKVPNVSGMSSSAAVARLKKAGYKVVVRKQTSSASIGVVLATTPASGTELLPGKTVKVIVAKPALAPPKPSCTPGYSPCLPEGPSDYDCAGGSGDGPAYTKPGVTYHVTGSDPYGLDSDNDGYGCE